MDEPHTEAEWDASIDAHHAELAAARSDEEYREIVMRQHRPYREDEFVPIDEVFAIIDADIERWRRADRDGADSEAGPSTPAGPAEGSTR